MMHGVPGHCGGGAPEDAHLDGDGVRTEAAESTLGAVALSGGNARGAQGG